MKKKILSLFILSMFVMTPVIAKEKIKVDNPQNGIYVFKINTKKYGSKIKPYVTANLTTPQKVYEQNCFDLVVNGGFFDVKSGKSVSYTTIDSKVVSDPSNLPELVGWLKKEERLDKVLSRSELRILENDRNKLKFDIARHNDPVKKGYHIKHVLQAGPGIIPCVDLVGEGFVVYENDRVKMQSVDILKRRERTLIGLKGNNLYIVLFTKDHKVDANELKQYAKDTLKLKKAMALDGGLSTAINYKDMNIGSLGKYQRRVKSFLVIER